MMIEPGAEAILKRMGRSMGTKARSKTMNGALTHLRENVHMSEVSAWFSELRFAPSRRTTVRLSPENADYANILAAMIGRGRPSILLDIVYLAATHMDKEDYEALK
ncbi:MAG: hypothetical protein COA91_07630 [Robiginitomaculum sp.]|nr:MAG: hypothetical protein COA91_07630 [Robiginitomaculum sp.]